MSVLVNLLPDVRLQRQREAERKRIVGVVAFLVWVACGAVIGVLLLVVSSQLLLINKTKGDISNKKSQLQSMSDLKDALTAQSKLQSLSTLSSSKPVMTKLFAVIGVVSPTTLQLTSLKYDASTHTLNVTGNVKTYAEVQKLVKAMEVGNTLAGGSSSTDPYFTNVTLSTTTRSNTGVDFGLTAIVQKGATSGN